MRTIKEIITSTNITQSEMEYVVESYIKDMKGVDVTINLNRFSHPFYYKMQLSKLNAAYDVAVEYFYKTIKP